MGLKVMKKKKKLTEEQLQILKKGREKAIRLSKRKNKKAKKRGPRYFWNKSDNNE